MSRCSATAAFCSLLGLSAYAGAVSNHPNPAPSAVRPKATSVFLTNVVSIEDSCGGVRYSATLNMFGTTNDGGGNDIIWFTIYDDQQEKFAQSSAPVGQSRQHQVTAEYPGRVGQVAPGIAILVGESRGTDELISMTSSSPRPPAAAPSAARRPRWGSAQARAPPSRTTAPARPARSPSATAAVAPAPARRPPPR